MGTPRAYRQILFFSCCSHLLILRFCCELDEIINVFVDVVLVGEPVSHLWGFKIAQWCCWCFHGIVDVARAFFIFLLFLKIFL